MRIWNKQALLYRPLQIHNLLCKQLESLTMDLLKLKPREILDTRDAILVSICMTEMKHRIEQLMTMTEMKQLSRLDMSS